MAKNLIIYGSPNRNSFTAKLLEEEKAVLSGEVLEYDCFKSSPAPCDACGLCLTKDVCKNHDLDEFFDIFQKADNVIFAFPIYNGSFPAPLKALIDRFQRFYNARFTRNIRPPMQGRRDVTLIITKGSNMDTMPIVLPQLEPMFTICGCKLKKAIVLMGTDNLSPSDPLIPTVTYYNSGE